MNPSVLAITLTIAIQSTFLETAVAQAPTPPAAASSAAATPPAAEIDPLDLETPPKSNDQNGRKGVKVKRSKDKTTFDFDEVGLDGRMKAPAGMMLKGRVQQNKNQLVNLRRHFREDVKKSRAAVKAVLP